MLKSSYNSDATILKTLPKIIELALQEDCVDNDITSDLTIDDKSQSSFQINARENLVFCGKMVVEEVFLQLKQMPKFQESQIDFNFLCQDGEEVESGNNILVGQGDSKLILVAERTILNMLQHLSSIATNTYNYLTALNNPKIKILDTRKTLPFMRELQKYAVRCGGGNNHRFSLADLILIKDNHIQACGGIKEVLAKVKNTPENKIYNKKIEIECDKFSQVKEAVKHSPDIIMLDNMLIEELKNSINEIRLNNPKILIEISGGINLKNIQNYRDFDIDFISIGSLTTSIKAVDIGLDFL